MMRDLLFTISILFAFVFLAQAQTFYGTTDLKAFREGRDKAFRDKDESPLKEEDFSAFKGLNYFPEDKKFRVTASFRRTSGKKYFRMPTSTGESKKFVKYGVLTFKLNGKWRTLSVYQAEAKLLKEFPEYADLLFVPFRDLTSGGETYGGGRYIDIKTPAKNKAILDFNLAYNPNCAYGSDGYSCPIPPKENFLRVKISAGERTFDYFGKKQTETK